MFCTYLKANLLKEKCYMSEFYCQQISYYAYLSNVHLYDAVFGLFLLYILCSATLCS